MSKRVVWVLPSVDPFFRGECLAGLRAAIREKILVLDNSRTNRGCAASWNLGIERVFNEKADWLVIVSESVRFGPAGGADLEAGLDGAITWAACDKTCDVTVETGEGFCRNGFGFHLVAIAASTFETVGRFDPVFWPAWWEDSDFVRRMTLSGVPLTGTNLDGVDAHLVACEHSTATSLVPGGWGDTLIHYERKWGNRPGAELWTHPYNDPSLDWTHTGGRP